MCKNIRLQSWRHKLLPPVSVFQKYVRSISERSYSRCFEQHEPRRNAHNDHNAIWIDNPFV